eukprot:5404414-Alexandrium_andersonii.AAC.1
MCCDLSVQPTSSRCAARATYCRLASRARAEPLRRGLWGPPQSGLRTRAVLRSAPKLSCKIALQNGIQERSII